MAEGAIDAEEEDVESPKPRQPLHQLPHVHLRMTDLFLTRCRSKYAPGTVGGW